jgi:type II secretory pathway pseudopilin PulG
MKIYNRGQTLIQALVFGVIAAFLIAGLVSWFAISIKASRQTFNREQAIQIAEAGIDYYRWHLAHSPQDYQDGTAGPGPYIHDFLNKDGNIIGQFILEITPPPLGSTLVTVKSTGKVSADPNISRTITAKLAKPSIAKYAVAANDVMRFGEGTEVFGPIHSNQGIRFDGLAHNIISSAVSQYNDPDPDDCNNNVSFGVHTCVNPHDPSPPASVPNRIDIFQAGRQFPVPAIDFTGITADLAQMKSDAQADGFYRSSSGNLGYHVVLKTDDTFDLYRVTSFVNPPSGCTNYLSQS